MKGEFKMTKTFHNENGFLSLSAVSKEEDLKPTGYRALVNPPPQDGRCHVCGRHISELKPFGGPGDPLVGDFTGELLVKRFRRDYLYYNEEAAKAWEEADKAMKETPGLDVFSWFITRYGEEKGERLCEEKNGWGEGWISPSWECRDCIVMDDFEYNRRKP